MVGRQVGRLWITYLLRMADDEVGSLCIVDEGSMLCVLTTSNARIVQKDGLEKKTSKVDGDDDDSVVMIMMLEPAMYGMNVCRIERWIGKEDIKST